MWKEEVRRERRGCLNESNSHKSFYDTRRIKKWHKLLNTRNIRSVMAYKYYITNTSNTRTYIIKHYYYPCVRTIEYIRTYIYTRARKDGEKKNTHIRIHTRGHKEKRRMYARPLFTFDDVGRREKGEKEEEGGRGEKGEYVKWKDGE